MSDREPELLPRHAHRALLYVEKLGQVGEFPLCSQVEALALSDGPRDAVYESPLSVVAQQFASAGLKSSKVRDAEPVCEWLLRMGWLELGKDTRLSLTDLGRALLASLRLSPPAYAADREGAAAVVLRPDDPLVYSEITRIIARAGAGMIVDPYFKADMLEWLHSATSITRLLMSSSKQPREVEQIAIVLHGLAQGPVAGRVEVRATGVAELHDRCILADDGQVLFLGTSITGIGRHLTTVFPFPPPAAAAMRQEVERIWKDAEPVVAKPIRRPLE